MTPRVLYANRVATYSGPTAILIRFLYALGLDHSSAEFPDDAVQEINHVCAVAIDPSVARRLVEDLLNALTFYERRMGVSVPTIEALADRWNGSEEGVK